MLPIVARAFSPWPATPRDGRRDRMWKNQLHPRRQLSRPGFTLLEMLTTVAVLIIVLGLMVSLARYVRNQLAVELTKGLLHKLDELTAVYHDRHSAWPRVTPFVGAGPLPDEQTLQQLALRNNRDFVFALRSDGLLAEESFGGLPQTVYNDATLRDAWGSPIVFMPAMRIGIGMAPHDNPFFFSAGPDRAFRTTENNLYSYEK